MQPIRVEGEPGYANGQVVRMTSSAMLEFCVTVWVQLRSLGLPTFPFSQDNLSHEQKLVEYSFDLSGGSVGLSES